MQDTTLELVREALVGLDIPEEEVVPEAKLRDDLEIDSTELVEVIAFINTRAGTRLESKALKGVRTVGELADLVEGASQSTATA